MLQHLDRFLVAEIPANEGDAGEPRHVEEIERDHPSARRDPPCGDLRPAPGRRPQIHHQHARPEQAVVPGDFLELVGGARAHAFGARALHVRVGNVLFHPGFASDSPHPLHSQQEIDRIYRIHRIRASFQLFC